MRFSRALSLILAVLGCTRRPAQPASSDSTVPAAADSVSATGGLPAPVRAGCDSAAAIVREALPLDFKREEGGYTDSFQGARRVGCRLRAEGSFAALKDPADPVGALDAAFTRHGWRSDLRYGADGPDGSAIGLRRLDMLCLVRGSWEGGDDSDTTPAPPTAADHRFETVVECARDVASNESAGVPDSIWGIAASAGLDSVYAISLRLQYPPYLEGDFDGDGATDVAVLVEHRASGKMGVVIVRPATRRVSILAAGAGGAGPDDLSWIDRWDVFRKGVTFDLTIRDRPSIQLGADALWVGRQDSVSAFYVWTGSNYVWEAHQRNK